MAVLNVNSKSEKQEMKRHSLTFSLFLLLSLLTMAFPHEVEAKACKPNGKVRGKAPPHCSDCCEKGKYYDTYACSPKVSSQTKAVMTFSTFDDDKPPSTCEGKFYPDDTLVVKLSTGWFDKKKRCSKNVVIFGNGKNVTAKVVDECDSTAGCDADHNYQPPCSKNIVEASRGVWKGLGVKVSSKMDVYWSDA